MYPNLELEMFKQKINTKQLADVCDISESAMRNKLKGRKDFKMSEAKQVMGLFHADFEYLFALDAEQAEGRRWRNGRRKENHTRRM